MIERVSLGPCLTILLAAIATASTGCGGAGTGEPRADGAASPTDAPPSEDGGGVTDALTDRPVIADVVADSPIDAPRPGDVPTPLDALAPGDAAARVDIAVRLDAGVGLDALRVVDVATPRDAPTDATDRVDAGAPSSVRVILAVGERTGTSGCYFASEARSDARGCTLHALDLDPGSGVVSGVRAITSPSEGGAWQPSANAGLLAFARRSDMGIRVLTVPLDALSPGAAGTIVSPSGGLWVWPNLGRDGALRLSRALPTGMGPSCLAPGGAGMCREIDRWNETIERSSAGAVTAVGGAAGYSLEDTWSHPLDPQILAGHGKFRRVGTARPDCATSCSDMNSSPMPIVLNTRTGVSQVLDLVSDDPALGGGTRPLTGCAHLAWSPDGARLLCTEQGTAALMSAGLQSRLYAFPYDVRALISGAPALVTTAAAPLFSHRTAAAIFPLSAGQRCDIFYHKYAEWCGRGDLVVATVGCGMEVAPGAVDLLFGRVFAIDLRDPASPVYIDLTAGVERATGRAFNDLSSFTATCVPGSL